MSRSTYRLVIQAITLGLLAILGYYLLATTTSNLERAGISTGFDFLGEVSGFDIAFQLFDYSSTNTYFQVFVIGIANTLLASVLAIVFCTIIGFFVGIAQLSKNPLTALAARTYVEAFRNIPLLLNILFWYFIALNLFPAVADSFSFGGLGYLNQRGLYLPRLDISVSGLLSIAAIALVSVLAVILVSRQIQRKPGCRTSVFGWSVLLAAVLISVFTLSGIIVVGIELPQITRFNITGGIAMIPELFALVVGLSIYHGAFVAEYVRGGLLSVSKGQTEAALSTGLSNWQTMRWIILPQALRVIIPPYISNNLNVVKNSSLGAAIAFPELVNVFAGTSLNQTGNAVEIILMVMAFYFVVSMIISLILNIYNKHVQIVER